MGYQSQIETILKEQSDMGLLRRISTRLKDPDGFDLQMERLDYLQKSLAKTERQLRVNSNSPAESFYWSQEAVREEKIQKLMDMLKLSERIYRQSIRERFQMSR